MLSCCHSYIRVVVDKIFKVGPKFLCRMYQHCVYNKIIRLKKQQNVCNLSFLD